MKEFRVMCRLDRNPEGIPVKNTFVISKKFATSEEALAYAKTVLSSREPKVLMVVMDPEEIHPERYKAISCVCCDKKIHFASAYVYKDDLYCEECRDKLPK